MLKWLGLNGRSKTACGGLVSSICSFALPIPVRYAYDVGQGLGCPSLPQLAQTPAASPGLVVGDHMHYISTPACLIRAEVSMLSADYMYQASLNS